MKRRTKYYISLIMIIFVATIQTVYATPPVSNSLSITRYQQENTEWCWAACAQMVGKYAGYTHSQSSIVSAVKGSAVNSGATDYEVLSAIAYASNYSYYVNDVVVPSIATIRGKIDSGLPIVMKMNWTTSSSGKHDVVVKGYQYYSDLIIVDPAAGCSQINSYNYDDLQTGITILSGTGYCSTFYLLTNR